MEEVRAREGYSLVARDGTDERVSAPQLTLQGGEVGGALVDHSAAAGLPLSGRPIEIQHGYLLGHQLAAISLTLRTRRQQQHGVVGRLIIVMHFEDSRCLHTVATMVLHPVASGVGCHCSSVVIKASAQFAACLASALYHSRPISLVRKAGGRGSQPLDEISDADFQALALPAGIVVSISARKPEHPHKADGHWRGLSSCKLISPVPNRSLFTSLFRTLIMAFFRPKIRLAPLLEDEKK